MTTQEGRSISSDAGSSPPMRWMPARRGSPRNCCCPIKQIWPRSAPSSIVFETPERWCKTRPLVKIRPFAAVSNDVAGDRPGAGAQYFRACLSESQDNGYNCCAPIRKFFPQPGCETPRQSRGQRLSGAPQLLMGFADNPFIGQSLTLPASVFFYTWSVNWTTCPSCGRERQCVSRLHASPVHPPTRSALERSTGSA